MKYREAAQHNVYQNKIESFAKDPIDSLYMQFGTSPAGMPAWQVLANRNQYGDNRIFSKKQTPWYVFFFNALRNPFNIVLFLLAAVALITNDITGALIIIGMVMLSVIIKFQQELKSARTEDALKKMVTTRVQVLRPDENTESQNTESRLSELPLTELVPGDIIHLSAGDMIPADVRLINTKTLFVNESALTGESLPIEKKENPDHPTDTKRNETAFENICFLGSNVVTGSATAMVVITGKSTYLGSMAEVLNTQHPLTAFDKGITRVSWLLIRLMLTIAPLVFLINGFTKGSWFEALLFGLSVAVGLTPEMLPVVVTTNLAKGALRMSKRKVIVKNLNSIQDIGAMTILCTDKTGTLTENRIVLIQHLDWEGNPSEQVLEKAYINSFFQSGLQNLTDQAILSSNDMTNADEIKKRYVKLDEIPFDFERRRMSVVVAEANKDHLLISKGATEEILSQCTHIFADNTIKQLDDTVKAKVVQLTRSLNEDGMRVILIAHKALSPDHGSLYDQSDETDLILDGMVTFLDPPKQSAAFALSELRSNNIQVKVLTGDNDVIARKVCREVGFLNPVVITGSYLASLDETKFEETVFTNAIFAKLTPLQKERIVKTLKNRNNVVGFMGDGINDAPALNAADIGISVDDAVDIARENADFILLEQDLTILNAGVEEGRKTYANTIKYIKCTASSNFGNIFSLIGASALFPFLPMLPLQILILNLIYDLSQTALPWDNVDKEFLKTPHAWDVSSITRFILLIGPLSSIFDYCTFAIMYYFYHADSVNTQSLFQTGWFIESLFTQTFIIQLLRTRKIPFVQSMASSKVLITAALLLLIGTALPYTMMGKDIGMTPLPVSYYLWLLLILAGYSITVQVAKYLYIRKYRQWL